MIIAIDGPAGSGKSTVARALSEELGIIHLNSGGIFRVIGRLARERGVSIEDEDALSELGNALNISFLDSAGRPGDVFVDGNDWTQLIREEDVGKLASRVAVLPKVRDVAASIQRDWGSRHSLVVDGRDAGTAIFPGAEFKFFLDAQPEVRARRRAGELEGSGKKAVIEDVLKDMLERDERDSTRSVAPQCQAEDAIYIDTSNLSADEVVAKVLEIVRDAESC